MINFQQSPYLREQRQFPNDNVNELARQSDQAYIDIASKVNARTIGIYAVNTPIVTGEQWYIQGQPTKQQTLRQTYVFTAAGSYPHGITWASVAFFTKPFGSYTFDGKQWFGAIFGNDQPITDQVSFYVTDTDIVIMTNGAAPAIQKIYITLEWCSQF